MKGVRWGDRAAVSASCAFLAVFVVAPLCVLLATSLDQPSGSEEIGRQGLVGLRQFVLLGRSLLIAIGSGLAGVGIGLMLGYTLSLQPRGAQFRLLPLLILPLLIPPFVQALAWIGLCLRVGWTYHGVWATVLMLGVSYAPLAGLLSWAGLSQSRGAVTEAARLGESRLRALWMVDIGLIRPHLWTSFLLIGLFSLSDYGVPSLLRVNTYPVVVFSQFAAHYDLQRAVLSAWPYVVLPVAVIVLWRSVVGDRLAETITRGYDSEVQYGTKTARLVGGAVYAAITMCIAMVPVLVLARTAGAAETYATAWRTAHPQIIASAGLSVTAALVMTAVGGVVAAGIGRSKSVVRTLQDYASLVPLALPGTILGIAMILMWNRPTTQVIYGSVVVVVLLYVARFIPFAVRPFLVGLGQIGRDVTDAGRLSPRSAVETYLRIRAPLLLPSALTAFLVCFVLCYRELAGTLLVTPPGVETVAVRIYSLYHYGAGNLVAALALFMVAVSIVVVAAGVASLKVVRRC